LDEHRVEELADVLGIGARHLTRLFMQHLGASPSMLARTRRVQIAKKLLDETDMTITEIAFVAGFSSIRRFNTVFKDTYGRSPSHLKRASRGGNLNGRTVTMQLAYRPPFNWALLAVLLATEATPGVEAVSDSEYRRTIAIDQGAGWFSVRPVPGQNLLRLSLQLPDYARLKHIIERVRTMFDLSANPVEIGRHLERHPQLSPLVRGAPGLRLPGGSARPGGARCGTRLHDGGDGQAGGSVWPTLRRFKGQLLNDTVPNRGIAHAGALGQSRSFAPCRALHPKAFPSCGRR
jgi:AraC family transcriptional regulator of adaptative response / DNA-3-methyladenine glycosylase II